MSKAHKIVSLPWAWLRKRAAKRFAVASQHNLFQDGTELTFADGSQLMLTEEDVYVFGKSSP